MTRYPLYRWLGRLQGGSGLVLKIPPPLGFDPRTVHLVASRYLDYAIPVYNMWQASYIFRHFSAIFRDVFEKEKYKNG
jgi:hypothetical protein